MTATTRAGKWHLCRTARRFSSTATGPRCGPPCAPPWAAVRPRTSGRIDWIECATDAEVIAQLDEGGIDVAILDGEAQPTGGMGLARQFKYEIDDCPAIVVLIARAQDGWLASWSLADAVINTPVDPVSAAAVVAEQLRRRNSGIPVVR